MLLCTLTLHAYLLDRVDPLIFCELPHLYSQPISVQQAGKSAMLEQYGKSGNGIIGFPRAMQIYDDSIIDIIALGDFSQIADYMTDPVHVSDSIVTGSIDISSIDSMLVCPGLSYVWISRPMFQSADSARYYSGIYQMNKTGYDGSNVTGSLIDNGMMLNRYNILTEGRDISVWNQFDERTASPWGFSYGEELDASMLPLYPLSDSTGHGTAMLSLLAGSDSASMGMLPYSDLITVNAQPWEKNVIEGIKYISDKCEAENRSFVLCLPLNHFWGRHDGYSPLDRVIDYYFSDFHSGRGIAVSAGNLGFSNLHFSAGIDDENDMGILNNRHIIVEKPEGYRLDADITDIDNLYFRIVFIDNGQLNVTEWILTDSSKGGYYDGEYARLRYGFNSKWGHLHITALNEQSMRFAIEFISAGGGRDSINGYIAQGGYILNKQNERQIDGNSSNTVAVPGLAKQAITAGAFVSRPSVPGIEGISDTVKYIPGWNPLGNYKYIKPDIYAPGKFIITDAVSPYAALFNLPGNMGAYSGTSFSSAVTAGAMAVVLGTDRLMHTQKLNRLMRTGADDIPYNPGTGQIIEGYGYIDAYRSFLATRVNAAQMKVEYELTDNGALRIKLSNRECQLIHVSREQCPMLIVSNYMALDITPAMGNNIYQIIFQKDGMEYMLMDSFLIKSRSHDANIPVGEAYYDILGRNINMAMPATGIYFMIKGNEERERKFIYIK